MSHDVQKSYDDPFIQLHNTDLLHLMQTCKPTTTNVFLSLHIRANRKAGNTCFPSLSTIADEANVSRRTVQTAIAELESAGFVTVENRVSPDGDATSNRYWLHRQKEEPARGRAEFATQVGQYLPHGVGQDLPTNHMNSSDTDETELYSSSNFDTFWQAYPRKEGKQPAAKAFAKVKWKYVNFDDVLAALEQHKASEQWQDKDGKFIPHAATWLNNSRWEDEMKPAARTTSPAIAREVGFASRDPEEARQKMIRDLEEWKNGGTYEAH